ncbi:hypothetical protein AYI70_g11671 [Smittium culicis]|uniref:CCHC-type domain-containing protein n=1 Tax=Smittium culicis TaxID=133412 RepID=A0A1R1X0T9_9FUNG|nr:hypothetical protein AYI70_g11671 [Smittium culicis]
MQITFSHNLKEIEIYQTEKIEEEITVVNIQNLGDVDILTLLDLIKDSLEPISEIIDISALCRKGLTEFLPYGVKILLRKKSTESIIPSLLDYEYGKINIFYRGCKEACSYCKQEGHWKSKCEFLKNKSTKSASDTDVEPNGQAGANQPSIQARKTENEKAIISEQIQKNSLGKNSAPKEHGKNTPEKNGNYDANNLIKKKTRKIIIPSTPVSEDSYGYITPTELEIMA